MINRIKSIIKKFPGIRNIVQKNVEIRNELEEARHEAVKIGRKVVDLRLKLKNINGEKINVVFVCHRPAVWESLHSVYDAIKDDNKFNVFIVAIPNKKELPKLWLNHEVYETEGAEKFWKDYGCINGYDYKNGEWFDLRTLKPDYVFFQQPYNVTRCENYKSWNVGKYAKICYLNYFSPVSFGKIYDECTPSDFLKDISYYFTQNKKDHEYIINRYKRIGSSDTKCLLTGYPRYDNLSKIKGNSEIWSDKEHRKFRVIWTPRWTTNEGNCHFFDFKDKLIDFCLKNEIELVFRPHPQAFKEWESTGEFPLNEQKKLREKFNRDDRLHLDESDNYLEMLYSSDCLISDPSSIIYDYFLTKKPIIYVDGIDGCNPAEILHDGLYNVTSWDETKKILMDLIEKKDILKSTREKMLREKFYINELGSGRTIASILKRV